MALKHYFNWVALSFHIWIGHGLSNATYIVITWFSQRHIWTYANSFPLNSGQLKYLVMARLHPWILYSSVMHYLDVAIRVQVSLNVGYL